MSAYDAKPWLALYDAGLPPELALEHPSGLAMFAAAVERAADRPAIHYFDATLTFADVDRLSGGLAAALVDRGLRRGDRVGVYLQNVPQFVIAVLAGWKAGAIVVPINPMYRARELRALLEDSAAAALVTHESLWRDVARDVVAEPVTVVTTADREVAGELLELAERHAGERLEPADLGPDDVAFLTYTSGTTGPPKGAMNTHGNVVHNAQAYRDWAALGERDVVLGVAPLFHITGLIGHLAVAMLVPMPLVLAHRFDAETTLRLIERHRATFTVAAITVFIALLNTPGGHDLSSLTKIYSGGAPIAPPTVEAFERRFGAYIHNIYGLTETTSPSHAVPLRARAPVDERSGALSVGVPVFGTTVRVVGDDGRELPAGEVGELVTSGPQVVPGYWEKPEETEHALPNGELHTGDVGFMDERGWFYLVDRKKDQINASGYKVWPREVEDVLYAHPAVREAAVVGVPDAYRGESVKAFVSLREGESTDEAELIAFCRDRMAAYKYPRAVEIVDDLPKTATGKILRRALRDT